MPKQSNAGLPSLLESRLNRKRQLVTGKAAVGGLPPKVFLWGLFVLVLGGFLLFWRAQVDLDEQRQTILTKQRATAKLLSPKLLPMRDQIEAGAQALVEGGKNTVDTSVDWQKLFASPGLYLRVRLEDAKSEETLRKASALSLRDGFSACLIQDPNATLPTSGKECVESNDCETGQYCNEYKFCQRPSSPFNMRMLYKSLVVLSEKWVSEVREAGTEYALIGYDRSLDSVTQVDLPIAIDVYQRAKYAVIVLDEDPEQGLPEEIPGAEESKAERVQRVAHPARIGVFQLPSGKLLARVRDTAGGELRDVGTQKPPGGAESAAARARQANSCGLALGFRDTLLAAKASEEISPSGGQPEADEPPGGAVPSSPGVEPGSEGP